METKPVQDSTVNSTRSAEPQFSAANESSSDTSSASSANGDEIESAIAELEKATEGHELQNSSDLRQDNVQLPGRAHSVEYWSIGKRGRPQKLLKKVPFRKSSMYQEGGYGQRKNVTGSRGYQHNQYGRYDKRRPNHSEIQVQMEPLPSQFALPPPPPNILPGTNMPLPIEGNFQVHSSQPALEQGTPPALVNIFAAQPPQAAPMIPQPPQAIPFPTIHIFIPPSTAPAPPVEQQIQLPTIHHQQQQPPLMPFPPVPRVISFPPPPPGLPMIPPQQQYFQFYPSPTIQYPVQIATPVQAVPYFQGTPLYYQATSAPMLPPTPVVTQYAVVPIDQPLQDESFFGSYARPAPVQYPPPAYDDAILLPPAPMGSNAVQLENFAGGEQPVAADMDLNNPMEPVRMEAESTTTEQNGDGENPWRSGNCTADSSISSIATTSSSDTSLSEAEHSNNEYSEAVHESSYYTASNSHSASFGTVSSSESPRTNSSGDHSFADVTMSSQGSGSTVEVIGNVNSTDASSDESMTFIPYSLENTAFTIGSTYDQFATELKAINDAQMNVIMQNVVPVVAQNPQQCSTPAPELLVYPGNSVILIYSRNDGSGSIIAYNERELPYVANIFDFRIQASFKEQSGPMMTYSYYVPPRTADDDFFGGQLATWQLKLVQYFIKFQPHNWRMHGVPETFNLDLFLGMLMDSVGEFHIVSKLRFCCRTCKTPWTSKKGTIVFKFCFNSTSQQGWILMRIFGQICMKQDCSDWSFQNPACYPEEIDRAMKKLSEYVGSKCYGIAVKPNNFAECFKSIRKSGVGGNDAKENGTPGFATPHKREFCQACMNGVCKNLYPNPHFTPTLAVRPENVIEKAE